MNNPPKILIFHSALAPYRIDYFNALAQRFDTKVIILYKNNYNQHFDQNKLLADCHFKVEYLNNKILIRNRACFGFLKNILKYKPDIVIGGEYNPSAFIPLFWKKILFLKYKMFTICDDSISIANECKGIRKILRNFLIKKFDGIFVLSNEVSQWYSNHYKLKYTPIVFPIIRNENKYRNQLFNSLDISNQYIEKFHLQGYKTILYIGRLAPEKNIDYIIKAFSQVHTSNVKLLIIGDGEEKNNLIQLCKSLQIQDKVIFPGRFEGNELIAWYNLSEIFILASLYEPYGAVVNEALASGCYVLCSQFAGSSVLIQDGNNGHIFNPLNNQLPELIKLYLKKVQDIPYPFTKLKDNKMKEHFNQYTNDVINKLNKVLLK